MPHPPRRGTAAPMLGLCAAAVLALPARSAEPELSRYEGVARPSRSVMLSTPLDERIASVLVREGQAVDAGELVAQMDDAVQRAAVESAAVQAQSDAELRAAEVSLEDARLNLERLEDLFAQRATSDWEVRQARVEVERQSAAVDLARTNQALAAKRLELETHSLGRYRVQAPFAGVVHRIHAEQGASLQRADPIAELVALDPIKAELQLPASLYGRLSVGEHYPLRAGAPVDRTLAAELTYVDPVMDAASETFRFVFEIDNAKGDLPANFTVQLNGLDPVGDNREEASGSAAGSGPSWENASDRRASAGGAGPASGGEHES